MGYMRHHAIVVTSWNQEAFMAARAEAKRIFSSAQVTNPAQTEVNAYWSFMVGPDGSKEGWADSDVGDTRRDKFIEYLVTTRYEDGSGLLDWVEVQYGDDNRQTLIARNSDKLPERNDVAT